jgi:hypothetical protein
MVDARKIAKLRAKAQSTAYPAEAESFRRKAHALMQRHGIREEAVQRALAEIFGGRPEPHPRSTPRPTADRPAESGSMVEAAIRVFEEEGNRPMRAKEIWTLIEARGLYMSLGRTPWATIASKLSTDSLFERVAPGLYRLRR